MEGFAPRGIIGKLAKEIDLTGKPAELERKIGQNDLCNLVKMAPFPGLSPRLRTELCSR